MEQKKIDEMTKEELEVFTDELLERFDSDSREDTELLERCYETLNLPVENVLPSERYQKLAEAVLDTFKPR